MTAASVTQRSHPIDSILRGNEKLKPKTEDFRSHVRKGKAGDHQEKLKPATIELLNDKFAAVLPAFGYRA